MGVFCSWLVLPLDFKHRASLQRLKETEIGFEKNIGPPGVSRSHMYVNSRLSWPAGEHWMAYYLDWPRGNALSY